MYEKLIVVTRKTRLAALIERFNTLRQATFYLEQAGLDASDYVREDDRYRAALDETLEQLELGLPVQKLERALVSSYVFGPKDLVVVLGQDGLVANTAKYVGALPIVGVNPEPDRFDGVLLPFRPAELRALVGKLQVGKARQRPVTLAKAQLSDGQRLLAFNDLFLGERSHASAHYRLRVVGPEGAGAWERHSSSGVVVSTGAGSTGWLKSVCTMAQVLGAFFGQAPRAQVELGWEDPRLFFVVREPFVSRTTSARASVGWLGPGCTLELESLMPQTGTIFSDGVESDAVAFRSGAIATVSTAAHQAQLVVR